MAEGESQLSPPPFCVFLIYSERICDIISRNLLLFLHFIVSTFLYLLLILFTRGCIGPKTLITVGKGL